MKHYLVSHTSIHPVETFIGENWQQKLAVTAKRLQRGWAWEAFFIQRGVGSSNAKEACGTGAT